MDSNSCIKKNTSHMHMRIHTYVHPYTHAHSDTHAHLTIVSRVKKGWTKI